MIHLNFAETLKNSDDAVWLMGLKGEKRKKIRARVYFS
jgi:hypothetical protein